MGILDIAEWIMGKRKLRELEAEDQVRLPFKIETQTTIKALHLRLERLFQEKARIASNTGYYELPPEVWRFMDETYSLADEMDSALKDLVDFTKETLELRNQLIDQEEKKNEEKLQLRKKNEDAINKFKKAGEKKWQKKKP